MLYPLPTLMHRTKKDKRTDRQTDKKNPLSFQHNSPLHTYNVWLSQVEDLLVWLVAQSASLVLPALLID